MQNHFKKFRGFLKGKGYYIVLLLCTAAVGATGFFLLKGKDATVPTESQPGSLATQDEQTAVYPTNPVGTDQPAANVGATQPSESTSTPEPTTLRLTRPVTGASIKAFSAEKLAYNETTKDWRTHEGLDLAAQRGEPVFAAADGTVFSIYEDEQLGMTVVLHHAQGYSTHYSNLSEDISLQVGQTVKAGELLGSVGQSACIETAAESHLHFALYQNNSPLDPEEFWEP